jgi:hypothetical protein
MDSHALSFVVVILVAATSAAEAAPISATCQPALDGQIKLVTTPHHTVTAEGNPPKVGEAIAVDGVNYFKVNDRWMKSPMTVQASLAQQQENIKNAKVISCTRLPDGEVDGMPATVYKFHNEMPDVGFSDAQIWLSMATGLPLRTENDFNTTGTNRHMSIKYDYANIHAPVVK